jgi:hypothetical protein
MSGIPLKDANNVEFQKKASLRHVCDNKDIGRKLSAAEL